MCMEVGVFSQKIAYGSSEYCDQGPQKYHTQKKKKAGEKRIMLAIHRGMRSQGRKTPKPRN